MLSAALAIFGVAWHYQRCHRFGTHGPVMNQTYGGIWGTGPQMYTFTDWGSHDPKSLPGPY